MTGATVSSCTPVFHFLFNALELPLSQSATRIVALSVACQTSATRCARLIQAMNALAANWSIEKFSLDLKQAAVDRHLDADQMQMELFFPPPPSTRATLQARSRQHRCQHSWPMCRAAESP